MTKDDKSSDTKASNGATISLRLLGGFIISFLLGFGAYGLGRNAVAGAPLTFSTPELINFVLAVVLSGASIFLAIAAIGLGKFSEHAIMQRSDESIRLQNEVFQKTTDALQRIESSTGVTEKRIEDIISGRVGDLSQKIAKIATEQQEGEPKLGAQEIAEMVRRSIYGALREEGVFAGREEERRHMREAEDLRAKQKAEYDAMTMRLLRALSSRDDLRALKMGRGQIDATGEALYDGIYSTKDGKKLGVIDFSNRAGPEMIRKAVVTALGDVNAGNITNLWIVVYDGDEVRAKAFADATAIVSPELHAKVTFTLCPHDKIEETAASFQIGNQ
jgi:hypothetical protein